MSSPAYKKLLDDAWALHEGKNAGYAGEGNTDPWANFRMSEAFGVSAIDGCLVRMSDKYIRVTNLRKRPENDKVNESIRDTLLDLSAYALIAVCLMDEETKGPSVSSIIRSNVGTDDAIEDDYGLPGLVEIEEGEQFICGHWWGEDPIPYGQDFNCGDLCHSDKTHGIAM